MPLGKGKGWGYKGLKLMKNAVLFIHFWGEERARGADEILDFDR